MGGPSAKRGRFWPEGPEEMRQARAHVPNFDEVPRVLPKKALAKISTLHARCAAAEASSVLILSWNIDGLDDTGYEDMVSRVLAVAEHIARWKPGIVLLQEARRLQLQILASPKVLGERYDMLTAQNVTGCCTCAVLLDKRRARMLAAPRTHRFEGSAMGRHYLSVRIVLEGANVTVISAQLESTQLENAQKERLRQLEHMFHEMLAFPSTQVIFGGDLNTRDSELALVENKLRREGLQVHHIRDAWAQCGSSLNHRFTWDIRANTNLGLASHKIAQHRFDRILYTDPSGASLKLQSFELVGKARIDGINRFPSDHWGVQAAWSVSKETCDEQLVHVARPRSDEKLETSQRQTKRTTYVKVKSSGGTSSGSSKDPKTPATSDSALGEIASSTTESVKRKRSVGVSSGSIQDPNSSATTDSVLEEKSVPAKEHVKPNVSAETSSGNSNDLKSSIASDSTLGSNFSPAKVRSFGSLRSKPTGASHLAIDLDE